MKKKVIVLSLGGSLIIPDNVDVGFLKKFKEFVLKNTKTHKFIIVCGGGSIARKYIVGLQGVGASLHMQGMIGITTTRTNARFMNYFFGMDSEKGIPHNVNDIKKILENKDFVFCGALAYKVGATTDAQTAEIATHFKCPFINLTNVACLYDKNPTKYKDAKFIPSITWKAFHKMATREKFKPGQHFVIDQTAAGIILRQKIKTYVLGQDLTQLGNVLKGKNFKGTLIAG